MPHQNPTALTAIPSPMNWHGNPTHWGVDGPDALHFSADRLTDWFIHPAGTSAAVNAPALLTDVSAPCLLTAFVSVESKATYDAGVLVVYKSDTNWGKVCLELSPQRQLMIVSVVTKGTSDDCNSVILPGNSVYLRLAKLESAYGFHYSTDGKWWNLVRHFGLGETKETSQAAKIGFIVQSPTGEGCTAHFSQITYSPRLLGNIRSGE